LIPRGPWFLMYGLARVQGGNASASLSASLEISRRMWSVKSVDVGLVIAMMPQHFHYVWGNRFNLEENFA
jgi:hypothetical protein